jgi:hypothetical protein
MKGRQFPNLGLRSDDGAKGGFIGQAQAAGLVAHQNQVGSRSCQTVGLQSGCE